VAENDASGRQLWVFGDKDHPEVVGIVSRFQGQARVFSSLEELRGAIERGEILDFCKN
jgi:4-hydroxy-3-methylbut-2-enyl diphosphate reductase IspH